jgi:hypothetical protein
MVTQKETDFWALFAKLRKTATSFVMSVRLTTRMELLASNWMDFHKI